MPTQPFGVRIRLISVSGYQYIVQFDTDIGDLPALVVDGANLIAGDGGNATKAIVTACDWQRRQTIITSATSHLNGTFYLSYRGARTRDLPYNANSSEVESELNKLDTVIRCWIEPVKVFAFGARKWTVFLDAVIEDTEHLIVDGRTGPSPIYAEGHLLTGDAASVSVNNDCPTNGRGRFPRQCNTTSNEHGPKASFDVMGCEVHSVAGRFGADNTVGLSGGKRVSGSIGYINNGLYLASYRTPRTGTYDMTVEQASCCGLSAEFFNNRWLIGDPIVTRIDAQVDFTWTVNDLLTPTGRDCQVRECSLGRLDAAHFQRSL